MSNFDRLGKLRKSRQILFTIAEITQLSYPTIFRKLTGLGIVKDFLASRIPRRLEKDSWQQDDHEIIDVASAFLSYPARCCPC